MEAVDAEVMKEIGEILTPDLADDVVARVRELMEPSGRRAAADARQQRATAELATIETAMANLTDAVAIGSVALPILVKRLEVAEERRQELLVAITAAEQAEPLPRIDWRHVERLARLKVQGWRGLLTRQVQGRPAAAPGAARRPHPVHTL